MTIEVRCECGKVFRVADEHAGKKGRCPACKRVLQIPDAIEETPQQQEEAAPPPTPPQPSGAGSRPSSSLPWQEREREGIFAALFRTLGAVLLRPSEAFSSIRISNSLGGALLYLVIFGTLGAWISSAVQFGARTAAVRAGAAAQPGAPAGAGPLPELLTGGVLIGGVLMAPLLVALASFIGAGVIHLCLMLVGGARETFEATYAVVAYTQGSTAPLAIIPFCGGPIGAVWGIVVEIIGLAQVHRTSTGKAALAVLLPVILCCGVAAVLYFVVIAAIVAGTAPAP